MNYLRLFTSKVDLLEVVPKEVRVDNLILFFISKSKRIHMKLSGGKWVKTRKCGCGQCYLSQDSIPCPFENASNAKWLWASDFSGGEPGVYDDLEPDTLKTTTTETEEVE